MFTKRFDMGKSTIYCLFGFENLSCILCHTFATHFFAMTFESKQYFQCCFFATLGVDYLTSLESKLYLDVF